MSSEESQGVSASIRLTRLALLSFRILVVGFWYNRILMHRFRRHLEDKKSAYVQIFHRAPDSGQCYCDHYDPPRRGLPAQAPVAEYPEIVPPTIRVSTNYPGASADVVATTVGIPIEQGVNGVENSIYMQSTSGSDGSYALTLTFAVGTDLNAAIALVQNAVNGALSQLPQEVQTQGVNVQKVSTNILLIGSLYSDDDRFDETFLSNYAIINLQSPIARLPGVGQVQVLGAGPYSMRIWLDPTKLQSLRSHRRPSAERDPEPEHPGRFGTARWAAGALGSVLSVHRYDDGPAFRRVTVRGYHRQGPTASAQPSSNCQID